MNEFIARNGVIAQNNSIVSGSLIVSSGITGSLYGTASYAISSSYAVSSSNTISASYATTASFVLSAVSASYATNVEGAANRILFNSAANTTTTSNNLTWEDSINLMTLGSATGTAGTISKIALYTSSFGGYGLGVSPAQLDYVSDGSHVFYKNGITPTELVRITNTGDMNVTGSITSKGANSYLTGSLFGTSSYALSALSASNSLTASYVNPLHQIVEITSSTTAASLLGSGSGLFTVDGTYGRIFTIDDTVSGSLFSVATGSWPIFEVFSSKLAIISGSLNVSSGITGSLFGTASWAISSSYALTASYVSAVGFNFQQSTPSTTWTITHNLNNQHPLVQIYDSSHLMFIPQSVSGSDVNTVIVTFSTAVTGYARVV